MNNEIILANIYKIRQLLNEIESLLPVDKDDITLEDLDMSVRAYNCLKAGRINTLNQLKVRTKNELFSLRNFGKKSLIEINEILTEFGYDEIR